MHKWKHIGLAHPHGIENIQKAILWAILAAKENSYTITILIIPDKDWYNNYTSYKNPYNDTHIIAHFQPHTIQYYEPTISLELNKKPRSEIHHKTIPIHTINLVQKISQIATNLQITMPYYINAPATSPINTKVHKHHVWQKTPNPSTNIYATISTPPLPTYANDKPQKFTPHLCYYTDGSFQPLVQVTCSNVICWNAPRAGYDIYNLLNKINISD
jgi:hypothetical protein